MATDYNWQEHTLLLPPHEVQWLEKHDACNEAMDWLRESQQPSLAEAWKVCKRSDWMLWLLSESNFDDDVIYRRIAIASVRETPVDEERTVWDLLGDERSRNAIIVAERYLCSDATDDELASAGASAEAAWASEAAWAAEAAWASAEAAWASAEASAEASAMASAMASAWASARASARASAWASARASQSDIIRRYIPEFNLD